MDLGEARELEGLVLAVTPRRLAVGVDDREGDVAVAVGLPLSGPVGTAFWRRGTRAESGG